MKEANIFSIDYFLLEGFTKDTTTLVSLVSHVIVHRAPQCLIIWSVSSSGTGIIETSSSYLYLT